jgi:hypothetical protein
MKPATPQVAVLVTLRERAERVNDEIKALEGLVVDARVRPILVAANQRLESVESRLRLVRGTIATPRSASQARD